MAGTSLGTTPAPPPVSEPPSNPHRRVLRLVPNTTRTRRCHGVFIAGDELAVIYSARREHDGKGVLLELGHDVVRLRWKLTPAQARAMARSLEAAAGTAERGAS